MIPKAKQHLKAVAEGVFRDIDDGELSQQQIAELRRRVGALDRGEATLMPGDHVMRELHERLGRK